MANLSGEVIIGGEQVNATLTLDDAKATAWLEGYIVAKGYDKLGLTVEEQALLVLADAGRMFKSVAQQHVTRQERIAFREAVKNITQDPIWESGIVLPGE